MTKIRIGIIGGGPGGLSLARFLNEIDGFEPIVFEAASQPGGKSLTLRPGNSIVEMGTCYTTTHYRRVHKWMAECGIKLKRMTEQRFDGETFEAYVKAGDGHPLALQVVQYLRARRSLVTRMSAKDPDKATLAEASMSIQDWLAERKLYKIERLMYRTLTNLGYGFVDEAMTLQAQRWTDFDLILSGTLKKLRMPVEGWDEFWKRFAATLPVRLKSRVVSVNRSGTSITLELEDGETVECDQVVCTLPVDDFAALTKPNSDEVYVAENIEWAGYTTTLFAADNWFTDVNVEAYKDAIVPGSERGRVLSARFDGYEPDFGGNLYLAGQLSGDLSSDELKEALRAGIADKGGHVTNVINQKMWKYYPHFNAEAVQNGFLQRLEHMQGQDRTWYSGATFSHQAVSHIVEYNAKLVERMRKVLLQDHARATA